MEEGFYIGNRLKNYCVKCGIDYGIHKTNEKIPRCDKCGLPLRTRFAGLALSGGGFRAALFHLGSIWRLNEMGWLKKLAEITSVSGGSITAAYLGLKWKNLHFDSNGQATDFKEQIVKPIQSFCSKTIDIESAFAGLIYPIYNASTRIASRYRQRLYGNSTLQDLPSDNEGPRFTIYATSLQTGVSVRFSKTEFAEYHLGKIESPKIPLAVAVAASSAFPPVLGPLILKLKSAEWKDWEDDKPEPFKEKEKIRQRMFLTDGGIYDNMGLERVWDRYSTVLVSDASAPFQITGGILRFRIGQLFTAKRLIDIINSQAIRVRRRWLMNDLDERFVRGAYWGIATKIGNYNLEKYGCFPPVINDNDQTESISHMRTRLNRFHQEEQEKLINWGYALTDAAMRRYVLDKSYKPGTMPYPWS
jgi:NTE family protein